MPGLKGVVLAGGEGKRFRPLTYYFQKCMIPVGEEQRPILEYIVRLLSHHGVSDLVLLLGYRYQQVVNYFDRGERFGVRMKYVLDDPELKGSANAILNAYRKGAISREDTLVVYYGDIISSMDLGKMLDKHRETGAVATIALASGFNVSVGTADLDGDRVVRFVEKPDLNKPVSIGVLIMEGSVLDEIERLNGSGQFKSFDLMGDVIPYLVDKGFKLGAYVTDAFWYDVGSLERYERLDNEALEEAMAFLF